MRTSSLGTAALAALTTLAGLTAAPARAHARHEVIDLMQFQTNDPDAWESVHRQSESLPFTLDEMQKLAKAGIAEAKLLEMVRTRRLLVVADADTLIKLKKSGASDNLVAAVSAYALAPNRFIDLAIQVQVATPYQVTQAPYLYIEIYNLDTKEQETLLYTDLRRLLSNKWRVDVTEDRSDPLLPQRIRSLRLWGHAPAHHAGKLEVRVLLTQKPGLMNLESLTSEEKEGLRTWQIDYPGVSLQRACELQLQLDRDAVLKDLFNVQRADFRCRWD